MLVKLRQTCFLLKDKLTRHEVNVSLSVDNDPIEQVQMSFYLGVVVNVNFQLREHFENQISKVKMAIGFIK